MSIELMLQKLIKHKDVWKDQSDNKQELDIWKWTLKIIDFYFNNGCFSLKTCFKSEKK